MSVLEEGFNSVPPMWIRFRCASFCRALCPQKNLKKHLVEVTEIDPPQQSSDFEPAASWLHWRLESAWGCRTSWLCQGFKLRGQAAKGRAGRPAPHAGNLSHCLGNEHITSYCWTQGQGLAADSCSIVSHLALDHRTVPKLHADTESACIQPMSWISE